MLAGSPKAVAQRVEFRTVKCEEPTAYLNKPGSLEEQYVSSVEQYVREVPADTAGGEGGRQIAGAGRVQMCLERSGACTLSTCANKRVAHRPFF